MRVVAFLIVLAFILFVLGTAYLMRAVRDDPPPFDIEIGEEVIVVQTDETVVVLDRRRGWMPGTRYFGVWYTCRVGVGGTPLGVYAEVDFREWELRAKEKL